MSSEFCRTQGQRGKGTRAQRGRIEKRLTTDSLGAAWPQPKNLPPRPRRSQRSKRERELIADLQD